MKLSIYVTVTGYIKSWKRDADIELLGTTIKKNIKHKRSKCKVLMKAQDFQSLLVLAKPMSKIQMILPCQDLTACLETMQILTISNLERIFNCCTPSVKTIFFQFLLKMKVHPTSRYDWLAGGMENWCLPGICTCEWHLWRLWAIGLGHPNCSLMDQKSFQNQLRLGSFILWCTGFLLTIMIVWWSRIEAIPTGSRMQQVLYLIEWSKPFYDHENIVFCLKEVSLLWVVKWFIWLSTCIYTIYIHLNIKFPTMQSNLLPFAPWFWVLFHAPELGWLFASRHQTWMGRMRTNEYVCCLISSQHDAMGLFGIGVLLGKHKKTFVFIVRDSNFL